MVWKLLRNYFHKKETSKTRHIYGQNKCLRVSIFIMTLLVVINILNIIHIKTESLLNMYVILKIVYFKTL